MATETCAEGFASVEISNTNVQPGNEGWESTIFGCFDDAYSCLMAYFLPCVLFGYNYEIISRGECDCFAGCLIYTLLLSSGLQWILGATARSNLRSTLHLHGSTESDCVIHLFCHWCALAQEYKELTRRGIDVDAGWNKENGAKLQTAVRTQPAVPAQMSRN